MLLIHPEMAFMIHTFLILIDPPFEPMAMFFQIISGFGKKYRPVSPVAFAAPKIKTCAMPHRVSANELAVL
jgi:hypothetical protein